MRIRHVIRQELDLAFWMVRDQGLILELTPAAWELLGSLSRNSALLREEAYRQRLAECRVGAGTLLDALRQHGLDRPEAWGDVRMVPLAAAIGQLPRDAVVAPKRIYFEITRGCNLRCRSCFNRSGQPLLDELTIDEVLDVNRQAYEMGVFEIRYTGGECTIVPRFRDVVADARKRGFYVSVGTNGIYDQGQLEWLPHCGIDWFILSLDGDRDANDRVRGAGTYDRVLQTLDALARGPATRVRLNMVVARHNVKAIESVARVAEEYRVGSVNLIPLRPYGRSTNSMTDDIMTQQDFYEFIREVNRLRRRFPTVTFSTTIDLLDPEATTSHDLIVRKKTTCAAGVEACVVGATGDVYGCSYSPASFPDSTDDAGRRVFVAGNLRDDDLATIWRDSARWSVFRNLEQYKNPNCRSCAHYTVRCSGSCQIMAWYQLQHEEEVAGGRKEIGDFCDPYCFRELLTVR